MEIEQKGPRDDRQRSPWTIGDATGRHALDAQYFAENPLRNFAVALKSETINHPTDAALILGEPLTTMVEDRLDEVVALSGRPRSFLEEAITESRLSYDETTQSVRNQHFVSATLLRQFEEQTWLGERLLRYDVNHGFARGLQTASRTCRWFDFVRIDSSTTEQLWGSVEQRFPELLREIEDASSQPLPNWATELLLDFVALHLARGLLVRQVHEYVWRERTATLADELVPSEVAMNYFWGRFHLYPPSVDAAKKVFIKEFHGRSVTKLDNGLTFRLRVVSAFLDYQWMLRQGEIRICRFRDSEELILGDIPTVNFVREEAISKNGTRPVIDDRAVFMPLSPTIGVAVVGEGWENNELFSDAAALNRTSLLFAREKVVMRPSSRLESWCTVTRPPRGAQKST